MIIDQFLEIKISKKNISHYSIYFPNIKLKDVISINIEKHLQKNSNIVLNVKCDICYVERSIKYQAYTKNINSCSDHPIYTCDKCSHIKLKNTNIKKYGVEYYSKTKEYSEKFKSTMIERWGVEHALQNNDLKEKQKQTNLKKLGYENPFMDLEKIKNSYQDKWGVDHPSKVNWIKDKINQTNIEKFGFKSPLNNLEIREKGKKTRQKRYGNDIPMKNDIIRIGNSIIGSDKNYISYVSDNVSIFNCDRNNDHSFFIDSVSYHNRKRLHLDLCTVCNPIGSSRSIKEDDLYQFISSIYNGQIIQSYKDELEIDIYLPEIEIGFEFNGLYWHSEEYKERDYHLKKTNHFKERGIRIIHIWEDNWSFKNEIIKSQIRSWIGLNSNKIFARKCKIKEVSSKETMNFLEENHIQGKVNSIIKLGLYYNDSLVSVMTFDHSEGRKKISSNEWNLSRFCNKLDTSVIGGASKLLSYFMKTHIPKRIISYADKTWSQGDLYYQLGFSQILETKEDYKYVIGNKRVHKSRFRKSKLGTDLSESNFMKSKYIPKIWDCGKMKFEINI